MKIMSTDLPARFCYDPYCDCKQLTGGRPHYPPLVQTDPLQVGAVFVAAPGQQPPHLALPHASAETIRAEGATEERERIRLELEAWLIKPLGPEDAGLIGGRRIVDEIERICGPGDRSAAGESRRRQGA